jgi:mono/diheme cytochrome c family protein
MRRRSAASALAAALLALAPVAARGAGEGDTELRFLRQANPVRTLELPELLEACPPQRVEVDDPYYGRRKAYLACPLQKVLELGFGKPMAELAGLDFFFRARDGYLKPAPGARLAQPGGWVAYADAEFTPVAEAATPLWEPIDRRQVNPGPYYVVWSGAGQNDPHRYPWPYALTSIEIIAFDVVFPHVAPHGAPEGSPAWRGFEIFRSECIACHAVNGEGGKVGPDLNVPKSIVEYRPRDQIIAFVRDPAIFRYTTMPANRHLSDPDLAALVEYFEAMSALKHDPGARP